jgi:hypothetical protein
LPPSTVKKTKKQQEIDSPNVNKSKIIKNNMNVTGLKHNNSQDNMTVYSKVDLYNAELNRVASGE